MKLFFILIIPLMLFNLSCQTQPTQKSVDYSTIKALEVSRYMGTWYEIARFNHRFERGLTGVTATYFLLPDGRIQVINAGYKNTLNGKFSSAKAKAKLPNPKEPGKLKVYFVPFFGADYFILELDPNYQWAVVGSSSPDYLWILSRTRIMDSGDYQKIITRLMERGYATQHLIKVEQ